jgi:hypothetical protein
MVIEALLLICSIPQIDDAAKAVSDTPTVASDAKANDSSIAAALTAIPTPKADAIQPAAPAQPFLPVKPVFTRPRETHRQRVIWYSLTVAGHSGAAFDAWSTRRAVSGGYGKESNPLLRPFANSNAIYAATQVSPAAMDFLGKRMMVSQHRWIRRMWWVPQLAGASFSFAAGVHNVGVVH